MKSLLFALAIIACATASCTDGVNNVIKLADIKDENLVVHFKDVTIQTYDSANNPRCFSSQAEMFFPGTLKLVSGDIIVREKTDLVASGRANLTMSKNSFLLGTVCKDGVAVNPVVPKNDCSFDFCQYLGNDICALLTTPGTHTLGQLESSFNFTGVIPLPQIPSIVNNVLRGQWKAEIKLLTGKKIVADIKLPSNTEWLNIDR
ncbi:hypothetical protein L596_003194 [Steinernema carpocapsae]|uniref:Lipid-binding serum glycoprotein N-terminal domain-containing protein n=1 Tax=Steinernema carpocapsae TaxID=34508 RepID=A0A4U8USH1_STECR|nr:hypothetical protein L596_003194 [Steinernema carpocapsae]